MDQRGIHTRATRATDAMATARHHVLRLLLLLGSVIGSSVIGSSVMASDTPGVPAAATASAPSPLCPACQASLVDAHLVDDPWIPPDHRETSPVAALGVEDQAHLRHHWQDLAGKPTILTFIFTRCTNPNKCPRATTAIGDLARHLAQDGIADRCQLGIVTYEPAVDTPERLAKWADRHGVTPGLGVLLLRPARESMTDIVTGWHLGVSFQARGAVAVHDVELLVCDRQLRVAHRYHTVVWDEATVITDVKRLLAEAP